MKPAYCRRPLLLLLILAAVIGAGTWLWTAPQFRAGRLRAQSTAALIAHTTAYPADELAASELAARYERQQLFTEAIHVYTQAGRADPGKARFWLKAAHLAMQHGDRTAAIEAMQAALKAEPRHPEALTLQGEIALRDADWQTAYAAFQQAVTADANRAQAQDGLAQAAAELKRWAEAVRAAQEATRLEPNRPDYWRNRARAERLAGEPASRVSVDRGLRLAPDDPMLLLESARIRMQFSPSALPEAKTAADRAAALWKGQPQEQDVLLVVGQISLKQNDLSGAEQAFRKVLQIQPKNLDALYGLSQTLRLAGKDAAARRMLSEYTARHSRELAIGQLQMRVGRDPARADLWRRLGDLYAADEAWQNAIAAYQRSLQLVPKQPGLNARLSRIQDRLRSSTPDAD